jgi:cell division septation protein DedD
MMIRSTFAIGFIGLLTAAFAPTAQADQWDKRTILTVNEPIQVPTQVLSPGKYVMRLLDSPSNRHIVQVFNGDGTHLITTVIAIPNYRLQPTGHSQFTFWETAPGQPKAMRAWFYPGDNFGQEFVYRNRQALAIASISHTETPVPQPVAEVATPAAVESREEQPAQETAEVAQVTPPPPPPVAEPQSEPQADRMQTPPSAPPDSLPHTASPMPWIGLTGLLSLAASFALRLKRAEATS